MTGRRTDNFPHRPRPHQRRQASPLPALPQGGLLTTLTFGVSAASAIRWRQLTLRHGTPAAKPQGGDRRTARIEEHASFILDAIKQRPDPTLAELREMLAIRGVSVSLATHALIDNFYQNREANCSI